MIARLTRISIAAMAGLCLSSCAADVPILLDSVKIVNSDEHLPIPRSIMPLSGPPVLSVKIGISAGVDLRKFGQSHNIWIFPDAHVCGSADDVGGKHAISSALYDGQGELPFGFDPQATPNVPTSPDDRNIYHTYIYLISRDSDATRAYDLRQAAQNLCVKITGKHHLMTAPVGAVLEEVGFAGGDIQSNTIFVSHEEITQALSAYGK